MAGEIGLSGEGEERNGDDDGGLATQPLLIRGAREDDARSASRTLIGVDELRIRTAVVAGRPITLLLVARCAVRAVG